MTRRYGFIDPIILADSDDAKETKDRKIEIIKGEVFKDINLYTHKHVDARTDMADRTGNAVSSDSSEDVDGAVLMRYVGFRDANLRNKIQFALNPGKNGYANDQITLEESKYVYDLVLDAEFNDQMLRPLAEYIHRYLVFGALFDWYSQFGMPQASVYGSQLKELEDAIVSGLSGASIVKRPMQPFGPSYKYK